MCILIEYNATYSKTSRGLWQYYRDEPPLNNNKVIIGFPANNNNSISFKLLKRLESGFKRPTNWNKYQSKVTMQVQSRYLHFFN